MMNMHHFVKWTKPTDSNIIEEYLNLYLYLLKLCVSLNALVSGCRDHFCSFYRLSNFYTSAAGKHYPILWSHVCLQIWYTFEKFQEQNLLTLEKRRCNSGISCNKQCFFSMLNLCFSCCVWTGAGFYYIFFQ